MRQVVQSVGGGSAEVVLAPVPSFSSTSVLVETTATLISAGTERAVTQLAQANILEKARARPDLVRQVVAKARLDGLGPTIQAVRSKLSDDLALGYSGAGRIVEVGSAVRGFHVGDRVATAGGGFASHADFQAVPWVLASRLPDGVAEEHAAFAAVASVGLHGLRQADMRIGSKIVVVGLGLIGQITARLAVASGCDVLGIDIDPDLVRRAELHGVKALVEAGAPTTAEILDWSRGRGADAVVVTAGAPGQNGIIRSVPARCRDRATVVAVGDVGLDLDRTEFYTKELELRLARSYGPGRYDTSYEEWGVDYPPGYVRWTEGRNLEAVVDLLSAKRLDVEDLITHRFDIQAAAEAYRTLELSDGPTLGVVLTYDSPKSSRTTIRIRPPRRQSSSQRRRVGLLGAGNFVRGVVVPALEEAEIGPIVHVASAGGLSAARLAERVNAGRVSSAAAAVINDDEVDLVVVATPHSAHADLVAEALRAGKDVYCEKPVALSWEELGRVEAALDDAEGRLYVGFNRRYAPMVRRARGHLEGSGPMQIQYRVNAGVLPAGHWYSDRREGGRLLGEVCHFVDTCSFLAGDGAVASLRALGPGTDQHDSYHLLIGYEDGSSASVVYSADGHAGTPKERIEISGGGHTIVIDNFTLMVVDGERIREQRGKGHAAGLASYLSTSWAVSPGSLETSRLMLEANEQLRVGGV